jgi:hypothetical protein
MPPSPHSIRLSPISEKTVVQEANATPSIKLRLKMSITEMQFRVPSKVCRKSGKYSLFCSGYKLIYASENGKMMS